MNEKAVFEAVFLFILFLTTYTPIGIISPYPYGYGKKV